MSEYLTSLLSAYEDYDWEHGKPDGVPTRLVCSISALKHGANRYVARHVACPIDVGDDKQLDAFYRDAAALRQRYGARDGGHISRIMPFFVCTFCGEVMDYMLAERDDASSAERVCWSCAQQHNRRG